MKLVEDKVEDKNLSEGNNGKTDPYTAKSSTKNHGRRLAGARNVWSTLGSVNIIDIVVIGGVRIRGRISFSDLPPSSSLTSDIGQTG